ncbi:MAG: long-chain-fatty-acid--CoA ligase [Deltaproteobacteria bacterium]|nr:long-chain-fatty-acid--CoA ligase [Deltaproteobacteria bacterium]MBW2053083.1 long-chain-fatty-acid--CoA ligase [Deltaproteobacteria bacterium]MBW2140392.1 long-chain-fatty-acid--CoA ligase [Deltaproteobacteria bacterium]MBW2322812.1 long-chain-fatty-acid--CoA ligase [Deltaproteobacteria bacterium]
MDFKTYPEYSKNYPLLLTTFMKRPVNLYPNEIGVVYRNPQTAEYFRFTWLEWYQRTCRLAKALEAMGVKRGTPDAPGDRIATIALTHHYHLELYYAVSCIGAVLHPINMRLSLEHIIHTINHAEDKIIFFDDIFLPLVEGIYDSIKDTVEKFVYISDKQGRPETKIENLITYDELIGEQTPDFEWPTLHEDTHATLCYTTGTTGLPKGVMFTHRALYLMIVHVGMMYNFSTDPSVERLGEADVPLFNVPMFHIHAWGMPYSAVFAANKLVLPGMFTVEGFCELVQTEKVTSTGLVPTILAMIIEYPDLNKYDLSSLKSVGVGGAALPLGLKAKAEKMIPGFTAASGYGMTETAPVTITAFTKKTMSHLPKEELEKLQVKTGISIPGLEVQVVDEQGNEVPHDNETIGEIVIRGPWIMEQYYKDEEKTAEVWRDGWFHTGDVAKVDEEGYITIADRISDMIRSGSEMVPTVLLENLTATADFILEATYFGVPDEKWGQRPMAMVTLAPGATQNEDDVFKFLEEEGVEKGKITKWMLPDYVLITDEIPKTSVGKFNKLEIKKNLDDYLSKAKKIR